MCISVVRSLFCSLFVFRMSCPGGACVCRYHRHHRHPFCAVCNSNSTGSDSDSRFRWSGVQNVQNVSVSSNCAIPGILCSIVVHWARIASIRPLFNTCAPSTCVCMCVRMHFILFSHWAPNNELIRTRTTHKLYSVHVHKHNIFCECVLFYFTINSFRMKSFAMKAQNYIHVAAY